MEDAAPAPLPRRRSSRLSSPAAGLQPGSSSVAAAAAALGFPKWVLLEPVVFRRDDGVSFPDDTEAPIRASGTTSWGARFCIAFSLAEPPQISRLYAQLPGFPSPHKAEPLRMLAAHRHLALLELGTMTPSEGLVQNIFIFRAERNNPCSSSLRALPLCTEPQINYHAVRPRRQSSNAPTRMLDSRYLGIWCGDKEKFVVAELTIFVRTRGRTRIEAAADICLVRSSFTDDQLGRPEWDTIRVPFLSTTDDDLWKLSQWQNDAVIPFQRWLCWIDYHQGILFWDVSEKVPAPTVSFFWFLPDKDSLASPLKTPCSGNGDLSVVDHGRLLKFVYVARHDSCLAYEALKPGTGFTITCHTLVLGSSMEWEEDYTVTSDDLPDWLQRGILMFPRVDIVRPQVVHFLFNEFGKAYRKMSVVSIDLSIKTVESCYVYMDESQFLQAEDPDFIREKSWSPIPSPFLPCEFPGFSQLSRKRKGME